MVYTYFGYLCRQQGQTGRVFQLQVGSGLGIEQIFQVGSGWVSGIFIKYQVNRVLSGIKILIRYSPSLAISGMLEMGVCGSIWPEYAI